MDKRAKNDTRDSFADGPLYKELLHLGWITVAAAATLFLPIRLLQIVMGQV